MPPDAAGMPPGAPMPVMLDMNDLRALFEEVRGEDAAPAADEKPSRVTNKKLLESISTRMDDIEETLSAITEQLGVPAPAAAAPEEAVGEMAAVPTVPPELDILPQTPLTETLTPGAAGFTPEALKTAEERKDAEETRNNGYRDMLRRMNKNN